MSTKPNPFVWHDLMTSDVQGAEAFYKAVVGWKLEDSGMPPPGYTLLLAGDVRIGGIMPTPDGGRIAMWTGYVGVDDVDEHTERFKRAGGSVHKAPADIPAVGRFSVVADPFGAALILFKGTTGTTPSQDASKALGHVGWNELYTEDLDTAWAFYSGLFGWTKGDAIDMGPMGIYQLFRTGGEDVGGMMKCAPETPAVGWQYYFNVDGVDAAAARVKASGGSVVMGPHEVPGGMWIVACRDPQGGMFSLVANRR